MMDVDLVRELLDYGLPLALLVLGALQLRYAVASLWRAVVTNFWPEYIRLREARLHNDTRLVEQLASLTEKIDRLIDLTAGKT